MPRAAVRIDTGATGGTALAAAGVKPCLLTLPRGVSGLDEGVMSAGYSVLGTAAYDTLASMISDGCRRGVVAIPFNGSLIRISTTRTGPLGVRFSVTSGGLPMCRADVSSDGVDTSVLVTYRSELGGRLLTVPYGVRMLEVMMGQALAG